MPTRLPAELEYSEHSEPVTELEKFVKSYTGKGFGDTLRKRIKQKVMVAGQTYPTPVLQWDSSTLFNFWVKNHIRRWMDKAREKGIKPWAVNTFLVNIICGYGLPDGWLAYKRKMEEAYGDDNEAEAEY